MDRFAFDDLYVRRLKEHDRETEDHFNKYFRALLFAKLRGRIAAQDIDDVIQDVFLRVLPRLQDLREGVKLGAFMLGFCNKILLERYRKEGGAEPLTDEHEQIPGKSDIEAEFISEEAAARVRLVLSRMNDRHAAILRAIFLQDADREKICRSFGVSDKYLRVLLHRAKEKFRRACRRKK